MRQTEEIKKRIDERKGVDANPIFPFEVEDYMRCVSEYLGDPDTEKNILKKIINYLPFWKEKCEGRRGISALRGLQHYTAWLWLVEYPYYDDFVNAPNPKDGDCAQYYGYDGNIAEVETRAIPWAQEALNKSVED